jgi:hypothetical protein
LRFFFTGSVFTNTSSAPAFSEEEEVVDAGGGVTAVGRSYKSAFGDLDPLLTGVGASSEDSSVVISSDNLVRRRVETGVPRDETLSSGETTAEVPVTAFRRVDTGISTKLLVLRLRLVAENGEPERKDACTKTGLQGIREYRNILQRLWLVRRADRCIPEATIARVDETTRPLAMCCVVIMNNHGIYSSRVSAMSAREKKHENRGFFERRAIKSARNRYRGTSM